jgi:hypothetical protein
VEVRGSEVDVGLAAIADVPTRGSGPALRYAVRAQRLCYVGCAGSERVIRRRAYDGCGVGLDGEEVCGAVDVIQIFGGERYVVRYGACV